MSLGEFEVIQRYFAEASTDASVILGIGDDCAVLEIPQGEHLAVSIDTLVEGTHFLPDTPADKLASRLLGAALSDLAAMGATPAWLTLALTLPTSDAKWLEEFSSQLILLCHRFNVSLVGGDTTRGPLTLSAQVHGFVPKGQGLRRSGANIGDLICVSGCLGASRAGLECLLQSEAHISDSILLDSFYAPEPQLALGRSLIGIANCCIDLSDGLLADLQHILTASGDLGANLVVDNLPLSEETISCFGLENARQWALSGGEDFQLCFTLPADQVERLASLPATVTVIGEVRQQKGIELQLQGKPYATEQAGYDHFSASVDG